MRIRKDIIRLILVAFMMCGCLSTEVMAIVAQPVSKKAKIHKTSPCSDCKMENVLIDKLDGSTLWDKNGHAYNISNATIIHNNSGTPKVAEMWIKNNRVYLVILK